MKKQSELIPRKSDEEISQAEAQVIELSKKIDFYITEYSVEFLANKIRNGDFVIPDYQRKYSCEPERRSRFIESLIIGLPIPFIFFWEMQNGKLEIVDGSQRLRSIEEFVLGDFCLGELQSLTALSGFKFSDLPESRQRKINNRSIRGIVLNEHADEQARFDLFERINTGSKIANKAEVRRGALAGKFMDFIVQASAVPKFIALAPVSEKDLNEREHEELVARLFAYSDGLEEYKDRPSEFIFKYVKKMNTAAANDPALVDRYHARFQETIDFIGRIFPFGFRKNIRGKATPRARFEAIAVGARLALDKRPELFNAEIADVTTWLNGTHFKTVTGSDGANAIARLRERTEFVRDRLLGE